jgi:hypothetical protein
MRLHHLKSSRTFPELFSGIRGARQASLPVSARSLVNHWPTAGRLAFVRFLPMVRLSARLRASHCAWAGFLLVMALAPGLWLVTSPEAGLRALTRGFFMCGHEGIYKT